VLVVIPQLLLLDQLLQPDRARPQLFSQFHSLGHQFLDFCAELCFQRPLVSLYNCQFFLVFLEGELIRVDRVASNLFLLVFREMPVVKESVFLSHFL
jgi:hypothetical protein